MDGCLPKLYQCRTALENTQGLEKKYQLNMIAKYLQSDYDELCHYDPWLVFMIFCEEKTVGIVHVSAQLSKTKTFNYMIRCELNKNHEICLDHV